MRAKTIAIVQARLGSSRLPGKVLAPILERPMLWWTVNRTRAARLIDDVIVATTESLADDDIAALCRSERWNCFRGSENDVLDRYYRAACEFGAGTVVRITSDCPFIDPDVIDLGVATYRTRVPKADYVSNCQRRTFPRGLDVEVFSMAALERAWREDTRPEWREHVTPYLYRTGFFRLSDVIADSDESAGRWTVDTPEDLEFARRLALHLGRTDFSWGEALEAERANPEWTRLNRSVVQKALSPA